VVRWGYGARRNVQESVEGAGVFGHHNLYRDGVPARSVIISVLTGVENTVGHSKQEHIVTGEALPQETPNQKVFYDVVADVEFGDGTTSQHTERLWHHQIGSCHVGEVLPVRYDRQHRDKIVFDLPELEANRYSPKERADGQAPAPSQQSRLADMAAFLGEADPVTLDAGDVQGLLGEIMADPQGFRDRMRQLAQDGGTNTFVFTSNITGNITGNVAGHAQTPETETGFPVVDFGDNEVEDS
jgi:hypothetical protein